MMDSQIGKLLQQLDLLLRDEDSIDELRLYATLLFSMHLLACNKLRDTAEAVN